MSKIKAIILAWVNSPGFAATHNGKATDEQIVDDFLKWLDANGLTIGTAQPAPSSQGSRTPSEEACQTPRDY